MKSCWRRSCQIADSPFASASPAQCGEVIRLDAIEIVLGLRVDRAEHGIRIGPAVDVGDAPVVAGDGDRGRLGPQAVGFGQGLRGSGRQQRQQGGKPRPACPGMAVFGGKCGHLPAPRRAVPLPKIPLERAGPRPCMPKKRERTPVALAPRHSLAYVSNRRNTLMPARGIQKLHRVESTQRAISNSSFGTLRCRMDPACGIRPRIPAQRKKTVNPRGDFR